MDPLFFPCISYLAFPYLHNSFRIVFQQVDFIQNAIYYINTLILSKPARIIKLIEEPKSLGRLVQTQSIKSIETMQIEQPNIQQTQAHSSGFAARDGAARDLQEKGEISFKLVRNDQQRLSVKKLIDLKNIFARQLPKMPKQYIVKLVFDRNHEAMIVQKGEKVIGGICFRSFQPEGFAQIAFLAISSTQQVRGFGTRLMNKLKQQMQRRRIGTLMTYADNLALGYFRKQGFSADCKISVQRWRGYVKDYEGGTMMECKIHPNIDYSKIGQIVAKQKKFVIQQVKKLLINHVPYNGANIPNGPPITRVNRLGQTEVFRIDPFSIPGVIQSGWTWEDHQTLLSLPQVSFTAECQDFLQNLVRHSSSWPFREAVSLEDVPDYLTVVREPMDLKTMQKKLINNEYVKKDDFFEDLAKIFKNCRIYNQQGTIYYNSANELEEYANNLPLMKEKNRI